MNKQEIRDFAAAYGFEAKYNGNNSEDNPKGFRFEPIFLNNLLALEINQTVSLRTMKIDDKEVKEELAKHPSLTFERIQDGLRESLQLTIERIEEAKLKKRAAADKTDKEAKMKEFAEANGFKYATRWHSSGRRNGRGYDTYHMIKGDTYGDKIDVKLGFIEKENKVTIISYSVIKKDITIDEVSSLVLGGAN